MFKHFAFAIAFYVAATAAVAQPIPVISSKTPVPTVVPVPYQPMTFTTSTHVSTPVSAPPTPFILPTMVPPGSTVEAQTTGTSIISFQALSKKLTQELNLDTSETEKLARIERKYQPDLKGRASLEKAMMDLHRELPQYKQEKLRALLLRLPVPLDLFSENIKYGPTPYDNIIKKLETPLKLSKAQLDYGEDLSRRYAPQFNGKIGYQRLMREFSNALTLEQRRKLPEVLSAISKELPELPPGVVPPTPAPTPQNQN